MRQRIATLLIACCLAAALSLIAHAQTESKPDEKKPDFAPPAFGLEDGTVVKLRLLRDLLSSKVQDEDSIEFEVIEDVTVDEVVVIKRGAVAEGTVIDAKAARRMGRSGRIGVRLDSRSHGQWQTRAAARHRGPVERQPRRRGRQQHDHRRHLLLSRRAALPADERQRGHDSERDPRDLFHRWKCPAGSDGVSVDVPLRHFTKRACFSART
jgi:hypothetical protein